MLANGQPAALSPPLRRPPHHQPSAQGDLADRLVRRLQAVEQERHGLGADLGDGLLATLTQLLTARGVRVVLDVSGPALTAALASDHLPAVIKPNRQELADWAGRPLDTLPKVVATARGLAARGIPLVVVSLGGDGALFVTRDEALLAHPPPTEVPSTVGAGDALVAGLVAGLHAGLPLAETARLALAFAAGKLTQPGANLPSRGTILAIVETVRVETIEVPTNHLILSNH